MEARQAAEKVAVEAAQAAKSAAAEAAEAAKTPQAAGLRVSGIVAGLLAAASRGRVFQDSQAKRTDCQLAAGWLRNCYSCGRQREPRLW